MPKFHKLSLDNASVRIINRELMKRNNIYGIDDTDSIKKQYKNVFAKFDKYINRIGIFNLPNKKYIESQDKISKYIIKSEDREKWKEIFQKFIFRRNNKIFLRGACYYNWLPLYIFDDKRSSFEKWKKQFADAFKGLSLIHQYSLLSFWPQLSIEEQLLILCILDHYKNSVFFALNNVYQISLDNPKVYSDDIFIRLDTMAQECTDLYYGLILDMPKVGVLGSLLTHNKKTNVVEIMKRYQLRQQGMRELDDPQIISLSVLSLLKQSKAKKKRYDVVIDFPCGGTELGLAYVSFFKLLYKDEKAPVAIPCLYSSKKIQRDASVAAKKQTIQWLFNFIPEYYHKKFKKLLKQKRNFLLYDNNVTTFGTLSEVKGFLKDIYDISADGAVAAVYYSNISKCLLGKKSEILTKNWQKTLDYRPVTSYITAFNTWGTSKKGKIMEKIFFSRKSI